MKDELAILLKLFSETLSNLNEIEFENLMQGKGKLSYFDHKNKIEKKGEEPNEKVAQLALELRGLNSRAEAERLLNKKDILKRDLIAIATKLNVHINKSENKKRIIEQIVESTVGSILRSKAIMETSSKRKRKEREQE